MRATIFNLWFYGFGLVMALIGYGIARFSSQAHLQRHLKRWADTVLWSVRVILKGRIEIRGRERWPGGERPLLIVSKHQSELDVILFVSLFPDLSAVAMKELENYPFFGTMMRKVDLVLVAIEAGPQGRTQQVVEGAARIRAQGRPMIIYPEGELMGLGAKERYRKGAAHIYTALDVPVVPVALSLGTIWPRRQWKKHVGQTGAMEFLEPIAPGLPFDDFMAEVERRIEQGTMRLIREHAKGRVLAEAEDRHARGINNHGEVSAPRA